MLAESLICLALNVYHEAKNQSFMGQVAVAQVVMNRVNDARYPNTVCDVVKQAETYKYKPTIPIKNKCQFSWYCDGKSDKPEEPKAWRDAMHVANGVYNGHIGDFVEGATHYHAYYVNPSWAKVKKYVLRIDDHIFYKWEIEGNKNEN
jgi:N-acetylmuramoyl-L-alanine amidase